MLSDTGGITSALISSLVFIVSILNYNHLKSYIASQLFKIHEEKPRFNNSETFTASKCGNLPECIIDTLPCFKVCCKKPRRQRGIQKARKALEKEIDVLELVKSMRFFRLAIKGLLSPAEIVKLEGQS